MKERILRTVLSRRDFAHGAVALAAALRPAAARARESVIDARELGLAPHATQDATEALRRALSKAAEQGRALLLPPGPLVVGELEADFPVRMVGRKGSRLLCRDGARFLLHVSGGGVARFRGVRFLGRGQGDDGEEDGLVIVRDCADARITDCAFTRARGNALALFGVSGGDILRNRMRRAGRAGLFALGCRGLRIADNEVSRCGNGGIYVWQPRKQADGAIIARNRISHIRADLGGDGPNGNGINVFRGAGVQVVDNIVRHCALTAVRANSADNVLIARNRCRDMGEVAIFVEFAFRNAIVRGNVIENASAGICVTNLDHGGRGAIVVDNTVRHVRPRIKSADVLGYGIWAEADTIIRDNTVERAATAGLWLGWGRYLENVIARGNILRDCATGIAVSVVEGCRNVVVADNLIDGGKFAIAGYDHEKRVTGELLGAADVPAHLRLSGNRRA